MIVGINYYTWDKYFGILIINICLYIDWDIGWDNSWDYAIYTLKRCQSGYFYLGFYYFTTFVLLELAILLKTQKLETQQLAKNKSKWEMGVFIRNLLNDLLYYY